MIASHPHYIVEFGIYFATYSPIGGIITQSSQVGARDTPHPFGWEYFHGRCWKSGISDNPRA